MKKKIIIPIVALIMVAVCFIAINVKPATARGTTPKKIALLDTTLDPEPWRCTYVDGAGERCTFSNTMSPCWPYCSTHCGK